MLSLRTLLVSSIVALFLGTMTPAQAEAKTAWRTTATQRRSIRKRHILHRPNRPLHVYGNTVRWLHKQRRR